MMPLDVDRLAEEMVRGTKALLQKQITPLITRLAVLEAKMDAAPAPKDGTDGIDGKDADMVTILATIESRVDETVTDHVSRALEAIPEPKNGIDGKNGLDGKDADVEEVTSLIRDAVSERVEQAVKAIPEPKNGIDGKNGEPGPQGKKGDAGLKGEDGINGKDGAGVVGTIKDADGHLHLMFSNGETKDVGRVVGRDGEKGTDGVDGLGFEDMEAEFDGERTLNLKWSNGQKTVDESLTFPVPVYRGQYSEGEEYQKGDGTTFGGSLWFAQSETKERPGTGDGWKLAVKKGRDGKSEFVKK